MRSAPAQVLLTTICFSLVTSTFAFAAPIKLNPQTVVDYTLKQGLNAKTAEFVAQNSYVTLQKALGAFDFNITVGPNYTYDRAQNIANTSNILDRTLNWTASASKKLRTGTTLQVDYVQTQQASILQTNTGSLQTGRLPNENLNSLQLMARQPMWRDSFGYADRLGLEIGEQTVAAAKQTREDSLQSVILDSMVLFWNTYTADQKLQEAVTSRSKYEQLAKNVRRKAGFNLASPGELPQLEATLLAADDTVKTSSAEYLAAVDSLLSALQIDNSQQVSIDVPYEIPAVPQLSVKHVEDLRPMRIAQSTIDNADRNLRMVRSNAHPQLDLVAKARSTGVDEQASVATSQMTAVSYPTYYVGLEFTTALDSDLLRGQIAEAQIAFNRSQNDYKIQRDTVVNNMRNYERQVAAQYLVAKASLDLVELRAKAVAQLEIAYRQGREPLVEVIRGYNDLFGAQVDRANNIGQYHIMLNRLAASRDELVGNVK